LFISACQVEDCFLIDRVAARFPDTHVLRPVFREADRPAAPVQAPSALARVSRRLLGYRGRHVARYYRKRLFGARSVPLPANLCDVPGWSINSAEVAALVRGLRPDAIVASDAPLLAPEIYSQARLLALNVHWGIAPAYRGNDTLFWSLHNGDFDHVGATIHLLTEGIDRGGVLARVYPELSPFDHELSIGVKLALMIPGALLDVLDAASARSPLTALPQKEQGTLYRARQRTLRAVLRALLRSLVRRPPRRPARIDRFF
jgi:hypothetical protein